MELRIIVAGAALALASAIPVSGAASADKVPQICVSRIYDYVGHPVAHFAIDFRQSDLVSGGDYATYQAQLIAAATPLGYDPSDTTFTLHELYSTFPFLYYGEVSSLVLVLCATGHEKDNECRRGEYYIDDRTLNVDRLSLILSDLLAEPTPAPVDSCDFGLGDWSAVG